MDELHARISMQKEVQECSILCFCETWLGERTPDVALTPDGYTVFRADRSAEDSENCSVSLDIKQKIRERREAFKVGGHMEYKRARYELQKTIKVAKRAYSQKLEGYYLNHNTRSMWQGIQAVTNYRGTTTATDPQDTTLPDCLNTFYAREENDLILNTDKTKEIILDFRKNPLPLQPLIIKGTEVEKADSHRFLGLQIASDLSWTLNTTAIVKKAQKRLYFIPLLRKAGLKHRPLIQAYRGLIESIITAGVLGA
ncbi:RNA-directed DNA polymerase from mobile element jockey-like protein [Labeo rohita]|uniref:RNA-directed DNA polymerase from mobile element jockey-like protein n=1 Tax=Labeo rohita TaxID=84645 RepID=A0A498M1C6_LABRO|nr:RNA-directed DNA polymerase from mobile element jockey-like protein [Labeo rohita]RXN39392.1 RNA-directed DNA polymerase from mobile element jockey-like protein [Labeo rohita]